MTSELNLRPLNSQLHLRLLKEPEQTAGGIFLPDTCRDNWQSGEVLAAGPGYPIPESDCRSTVWANRGDVVLFQQHDLRLIDLTQAVVREEALVAHQPEGMEAIYPLNDWVEIEILARAETHEGTGIVIPDDCRQRVNCGRVVYWGPGFLRLDGSYYGSRKSVPGILGTDSKRLMGSLVYWSDAAEAVEAGRGAVEKLFVRAGDLLMVAEEHDGETEADAQATAQWR